MTEDDEGSAFIAASIARVARLDEQLRGLHLGPAPLPPSHAWDDHPEGR